MGMMKQFVVIGDRLCMVNPDPDRRWDYIWGFYVILKDMRVRREPWE